MRRPLSLAAAALLLVGCAAAPSPAPTPEPTPALSSAPPGIDWSDCEYGQCAFVEVPVDHAHPDAGRVALAVARVRATQQPARGTIFINPGGPGASGREALTWVKRDGLEAYDLVGWDPRGSGASGWVECLDGPEADAFLALDNSPDDEAERAELEAGSRAFAASCSSTVPGLLDHLSSADNARDLEALRLRIDDRPLRYLGLSYGTTMGASYAQLFGPHVGRLVLDGAVDVNEPRVPQVVGYERALQRAGVAASTKALFAQLEERPVDAGGGRVLTQSQAALGIAGHLTIGEAAWPALRRAIAAARAGDAHLLLSAADLLNGRLPDGTYTALFAPFRAIYCADSPGRTAAEADARWAEARRLAPVMGTGMGLDYTCVGWPVASAPRERITAPDAAGPILVVGTTGDTATPYEWSEALASDLETAVLLTHEGEGHTAYGRGSACVDEAVVAFLTDESPSFTPKPSRC